ncbi:MAG: hypothetical protein NZ958_04430 [Bacteroidia bacterium]|nr:hypothetical protein [Bacteroidia bacterium]MDW8088466.1 hypothetical protein [Bacteroidia bacterium]
MWAKPSGAFAPEWLYYEGRLWRRPGLYLQEGRVLGITPEPDPWAVPVEGLLSPAWVNAHVHLEFSAWRGQVPRGRGMIDFLRRMTAPRLPVSAETIYNALTEAMAEGTWAFVSHQNQPLPPDAIPSEVTAVALAEFYGLRLRGALRRYRRLQRWGYPLTPHSFYALNPLYLRLGRHRTPFPRSVHFFESLEERLWLEAGQGPFKPFFRRFIRRPRPPRDWLYWLRQWYRRAPALWLVHATEAPPKRLEYLLARFPRLYIVLCPEANYYLFRRFPDLAFWKRYPGRFLLGTDSLANAETLSVWPVVRRLLWAGYSWPDVLRAVVDTPRRWIAVAAHWVQVAPLAEDGTILPSTQARSFTNC